MKVQNLTGRNGNKIPNQFIITHNLPNSDIECLQSYNSIIVRKEWQKGKCTIHLDGKYWDYSNTTSKYRNQFLGETTEETKEKIKSGEYILTNLN